MTLNEIIKPIKVVDEELHRISEYVGQKRDERGRRDEDSVDLTIFGIMAAPMSSPTFAFGLLDSYFLLRKQRYDAQNQSETKVADKPLEIYKGITKVVRTPTFLAGLALTAKGLYNIVDGAINNTPHEGTSDYLIHGFSLLSISSSIFLRDKDPKLTDKKPFWQRAYDSLEQSLQSARDAVKPVPVKY